MNPTVKPSPQTGSYAPNPHEGARSEYLAQYVFSSFGTSLPVLRQEDHGIDLHCSLSERKGKRAWPLAYFSVQVKSTRRPVTYSSRDSVEWLVGYPSPLLLCVVDKKAVQFSIYQTMHRFAAAATIELPDQITLTMGRAGKGRTLDWDDTGKCDLGPPILQFSPDDLMDGIRFERYRQVLHYWVLCDQANVRRYQMGMRSLTIPGLYTTNELPAAATGRYFLNYPTPEIRARAEGTAFELDEWLGPLLLSNGDRLGALLTALMLRHRDPDYARGRGSALFAALRDHSELDVAMATEGDYLFAPYDGLLNELRHKLGDDPSGAAS
jgi:Domain of unknown function (DUF4365)